MNLNERKFNAIPSEKKNTDLKPIMATGYIPEIFNPVKIREALKRLMVDQGKTGSCVGQAIYKALTLLYVVNGEDEPTHVFNPWWIWMNRPECLHKLLATEGTAPKDLASMLLKEGSCYFDDYKVDAINNPKYADNIDTFNIARNELLSVAIPYSPDFYLLPETSAEIKSAIIKSNSVCVMVPVYKSFSRTQGDGVIPLPDIEIEQFLGNHEMIIFGWNDKDRVWYGQNSYGSKWGSGGFFQLSYDYPIIESLSLIDNSEIHWADKAFYYLKTKGITVNERDFNDNVTRGEVMMLLARVLGYNK